MYFFYYQNNPFPKFKKHFRKSTERKQHGTAGSNSPTGNRYSCA